jgi:hypothetical protein
VCFEADVVNFIPPAQILSTRLLSHPVPFGYQATGEVFATFSKNFLSC